jgi:hypothetical protein
MKIYKTMAYSVFAKTRSGFSPQLTAWILGEGIRAR